MGLALVQKPNPLPQYTAVESGVRELKKKAPKAQTELIHPLADATLEEARGCEVLLRRELAPREFMRNISYWAEVRRTLKLPVHEDPEMIRQDLLLWLSKLQEVVTHRNPGVLGNVRKLLQAITMAEL